MFAVVDGPHIAVLSPLQHAAAAATHALHSIMVGQIDISTPAGQQMLYDFMNWQLTGHKPIPGFGGVSFQNLRQELYHAVTAGVFSNAAKKIAPVAVGKMTEEDFHLLLCVLNGRENRDLRRTLKQQRKDLVMGMK